MASPAGASAMRRAARYSWRGATPPLPSHWRRPAPMARICPGLRREERPDWQLFRDGCPGGESPGQIGTRADRVVSRVRAVKGDVLLFSSGHFLRGLAARWLGLDAAGGRYLQLST